MATSRQTLLGEVEQLVLLAILRLGDEAYAVPIRELIARDVGVELTRGTIYVTLERLEQSQRLTIVFATETHHRAARSWVERLLDHPISYTDAISFAVLEAAGCTAALSFDRDFEVAGFRRWHPE